LSSSPKLEVVGSRAFAVDAQRPRSGGWFVRREKQFPPPVYQFFNQLPALENGHRRIIKLLHDKNARVGAAAAAYPFSGDLSDRLDEPVQIELFERDSQALDHSPLLRFFKDTGSRLPLNSHLRRCGNRRRHRRSPASGARALLAVEGTPPWLLSLTPAATALRDSAAADSSGSPLRFG
jgi:hypothetical protein